jgi:hypothetical protein
MEYEYTVFPALVGRENASFVLPSLIRITSAAKNTIPYLMIETHK